MDERNLSIAYRLKNFLIALFILGFVLLLIALPFSVYENWDIAVPLMVAGGVTMFIGIMLMLAFHHWIDEVINKVRKVK